MTQGHFWPESDGAGIKPGDPGAAGFGSNPWNPGDQWNKSEQSAIFTEKGADKAKQMSQAAGAGDNPMIPRHPKDQAALARPNAAAG